MSLSLDLQGDIAAVLDDPDFGRDVTLRKITIGTYDPTTGVPASVTTADYVTRGLLIAYRDSVVNGTLILNQDRKCIIKVKNLAVAPAINDQLIVGADKYTIVNFKQNELGGTVFLYTLQLRK